MGKLRFVKDNLYIVGISVVGAAVCLPAFRPFPRTEVISWIVVSVAFLATLIAILILGITGVWDEESAATGGTDDEWNRS